MVFVGVSIFSVVVPPGFININGPFIRRGALYRGDAKNNIHLLTVLWLEFPLHFNLLRLSRVKGELSEISLTNQILKVSLEGPTVDVEMAHPVMEGAVLSGSRSLRVL